MFVRNVGVLSRLAYSMTSGRARNHFYLFIFFLRKEQGIYTLVLFIFGCGWTSFLDVLSVVSCILREWSASQ